MAGTRKQIKGALTMRHKTLTAIFAAAVEPANPGPLELT
jgi:hypothetical protein